MRKTISVALMCLLVAFSTAANADRKTYIKEVCINGLAYVLVVDANTGYGGPSVAIVQVYVPGEASNRPPQPKTCGN